MQHLSDIYKYHKLNCDAGQNCFQILKHCLMYASVSQDVYGLLLLSHLFTFYYSSNIYEDILLLCLLWRLVIEYLAYRYNLL